MSADLKKAIEDMLRDLVCCSPPAGPEAASYQELLQRTLHRFDGSLWPVTGDVPLWMRRSAVPEVMTTCTLIAERMAYRIGASTPRPKHPIGTLAVAEQIMREAGAPLTAREIVTRAGVRLPSKSKTPEQIVARDLAMDIKRQGDRSLFIRTAPGRYTLRVVAADVVAVAREAQNPKGDSHAPR